VSGDLWVGKDILKFGFNLPSVRCLWGETLQGFTVSELHYSYEVVKICCVGLVEVEDCGDAFELFYRKGRAILTGECSHLTFIRLME
jgi:hypothetical protein